MCGGGWWGGKVFGEGGLVWASPKISPKQKRIKMYLFLFLRAVRSELRSAYTPPPPVANPAVPAAAPVTPSILSRGGVSPGSAKGGEGKGGEEEEEKKGEVEGEVKEGGIGVFAVKSEKAFDSKVS